MKQIQMPQNVNSNGQKTKKKVRTKDLVMATWNVRTMLKPGKMQEIALEMLKFGFMLIALQEIRWQGNGRIDKPEFTLFYSGPAKREGQFGTGFIISKNLRKSVMEFEPINKRLCRIRLRGRFRNLSVLSAHAPTEDKDETEKDVFYEELEQALCKMPKYDLKIIMGDFNAKIGREDYLHEIAGRYSIHEETSENGELLSQFASRNNFVIKSTCFPHKRIHLGTWKMPGTGVLNQIDHVLVNARNASSIIDIRSCRGPNCDSDHFLVKVVVREKLSRVHRPAGTKRKNWNIEQLKKEERRMEYNKAIQTKLQATESLKDIESEWKRIEATIKESAEETIGVRDARRKRNEWFDEDCRTAIERMKYRKK